MGARIRRGYEWIGENIGNIYVFSILSCYPLFFHNYYFDIMEAKFSFFMVVTGIFLLLFLVTLGARERKKTNNLEKLSFVCMGLFTICGIVTLLLSDYSKYAFWGHAGRYKGWLTYALYGIAFLLIVWIKKIDKRVLWGMEISAFLAGVLGILNHYSIDIFGFYTNLRVDQHVSFSSTFGNINVFAEYLAVLYVMSGVLYCGNGFRECRCLHLITHAIMSGTILILSSDSGFFAVILFMAIYPLLAKELNEIIRYIKLIAIFFGEVIALKGIAIFMKNEKILNGVCLILRNNWKVCTILLAVCVVLLLLSTRLHKVDIIKLKKSYTIFLFVMILLAIMLVILVNCEIIPWWKSAILKMLHFSDEWGTYRGYLWRHTWEIYEQLPIHQKMFGIGQDAMVFVYELNYEVTTYQITTFDNAHNIYLQILISHGTIGLFCWLGWIAIGLYSGVKKAKNNPIFVVVLLGIVMYGIMGLVGLNMMHVSAIAVILLALCFCDMEKEINA